MMSTIKSATTYIVEMGIWLSFDDDYSVFTVETYNDKEGLIKALLEECSDGFVERYEKKDAYINVSTAEEWIRERHKKVIANDLPWFSQMR